MKEGKMTYILGLFLQQLVTSGKLQIFITKSVSATMFKKSSCRSKRQERVMVQMEDFEREAMYHQNSLWPSMNFQFPSNFLYIFMTLWTSPLLIAPFFPKH